MVLSATQWDRRLRLCIAKRSLGAHQSTRCDSTYTRASMVCRPELITRWTAYYYYTTALMGAVPQKWAGTEKSCYCLSTTIGHNAESGIHPFVGLDFSTSSWAMHHSQDSRSVSQLERKYRSTQMSAGQPSGSNCAPLYHRGASRLPWVGTSACNKTTGPRNTGLAVASPRQPQAQPHGTQLPRPQQS